MGLLLEGLLVLIHGLGKQWVVKDVNGLLLLGIHAYLGRLYSLPAQAKGPR